MGCELLKLRWTRPALADLVEDQSYIARDNPLAAETLARPTSQSKPGPVEVTHPYVERRPDIHAGEPVIKGKRFPVTSIVENYRRGLSVDEILREFPHLTPAQVHDALSYYYDHTEQINERIAKLSRPEDTARRYPATRALHDPDPDLSR